MVMGRPRIYDREKILTDMLAWAKKDTSLNVNEFCAWYVDPPIGPRMLSIWSKEDDNFMQSYEAVKAFLAHRREQALKDGDIHVKCYDICAPAYDYLIKEEYREQEAYKSKLKQEEQKSSTPEQEDKYNSIMSQLSSLQSSSNQATSKCNKDIKS